METERTIRHPELRGQRVTVVGAARSGLGAARLLLNAGARVTLTDLRDMTGPEIETLAGQGVRLVFGAHPAPLFREADLVVLSPGIPTTIPPLAGIDCPIIGELELASRFLSAPVVAVTGTNGKSTVTHLIHTIARQAGMDALLGGNVGDSLARALWERGVGTPDGGGTQPDLAVVEVSSFQLETITSFRPAVAVVLNISPDHLDRYPSTDEYQAAKKRIFENQGPGDTTVLNADDPATAAMAAEAHGTTWWFSGTNPVSRGVCAAGDGSLIWYGPDGERFLCSAEELRIRGRHNLENALAAAAAGLAAGIPAEAVAEGLRLFPGLPHRMEWIRDRRGVAFINDSKGTNVGAMTRSLEGVDGPVHLIAGGRDKAGDFTPVRALLPGAVASLILIGEAADKIDRVLGPFIGHVYHAGSIEEAVAHGAERACPGETVLLSPGCASFDQFIDFEDRGRRFRKAVEALDA